jgi:LL-diaminopimelate aminotransferase
MAFANENYKLVKPSYLFSDIARKVAEYSQQHPQAAVLRLGIGDVTRPLSPCVVQAMKAACDEMGTAKGFHGYGPEQGYDFLRRAVVKHYAEFGVTVDEDQVFIGDGAKSDLGNITDLFSQDNAIMIPDPVYPVYVDSNLMLGRSISYIDGTWDNGFLPMPDDVHTKADIIYLCSPNNPTGAVYTKEQLKAWVDYANEHDAVILYDAAYESFIRGDELPHSIFCIDGAETCAIEFCSLSKTAGFTGMRCGYTVVPAELRRSGMSLRDMWLRRQTTKFNGVSYVTQRGAEAALSEEGRASRDEDIAYYLENARIIAEGLQSMGLTICGGEHSPYVWLQCPNGMASWDFFDRLLTRANVVGTPGAGFGVNGEGCFRLTAFGTRENTVEAVRRIRELL